MDRGERLFREGWGTLFKLSPTAPPERQMPEAQMKMTWNTAKPEQRQALKDLLDKRAAAERKLANAKKKMEEPALQIAGEFEAARETYATLSRYEATIARSMLSSLHELQRLQAARSGKEIAPPEVFDVHISAPEKVAQFNGAAPGESAAMNGRSLG